MKALEVPKIPAAKAIPVWTAAALNLIPLAGVVFWGWDAFTLIFLYWLENVVIGARTLASMGASALLGGMLNKLGALFFGAFFTFHYGLFCFVHGTFVVQFAGPRRGQRADPGGAGGGSVRASNLAIGFASIGPGK